MTDKMSDKNARDTNKTKDQKFKKDGMCMKLVKKRKVMVPKESSSPYLRGATPEQRRWLKSHTISDLEEIVETLEYQGENVYRIREVIEDLKSVAANLGIQVSSYADYDLLEFVKADESKATA